ALCAGPAALSPGPAAALHALTHHAHALAHHAHAAALGLLSLSFFFLLHKTQVGNDDHVVRLSEADEADEQSNGEDPTLHVRNTSAKGQQDGRWRVGKSE